MFRRSRFSIRPNVGTAGRAAATPQDAPSATQEAGETPKDVSESSTAPAVTDNKFAVTPTEKPAASGDGNDPNGEGSSASAAVQRRKRFSIKPKVAPGRPSAVARTPKSPIKAASETPVEVSDLDKPTTSSQAASPHRLQSPRRRRPSEDSKQPKLQPKPDLVPSEPSAAPAAEDSAEQPTVEKESESTSGSQVKEVPFKTPDKVPPSLPDKEAIELSEKAKTLVSFKSGLSLSQPALCLSRLLNDPSDLQRLAKAQKLRELLKEEMHKEKKKKRAKARVTEYTLDPAKMTMRDLIRYLPLSNPMSSSLEESVQENETEVPPSPAREASPEKAPEPAVTSKTSSPRDDEEAEPEAEAEAEEEEEDGVMVPQVKVAEDGTLIIDEESLTVEVQRAKGPNPADDRDPIFERGSTTTYSSFRKGTYSKPWSSEETDMFFLAISMVGTDFSMICQLFPHRARSEIKNKFKKEERANAWRIDKAFRDRRKLDIEYFSKLLEKILEVQKNRKKLKSLAVKSPKKPKAKAKGKKAARKLSVVEEEEEEEQNEMPDLEEEGGEKENEDLCNEGGTAVAKPKKKRKRKNKEDASTEEPQDKKNKKGEKSNEQDEACIPEDAEAALPEDSPNTDMSEKAENAAKDNTIKPAKLSRGRAPKPLLPLGKKWGKKLQPATAKASDTTPDKGDESVIDGASEEQVNKDASPSRPQANKRKSANDDISSEEEDTSVQPPKPTRYGRVPKPTKPLNYAAKEASESAPDSPAGASGSAAKPKPKSSAKRARSSKAQSAQESKKPKLVTLRASQLEYSDEEDEKQREDEEVEHQPACSASQDSAAPVFVPASLRSPHPVHPEVEETMEELDILANMPDMLGMSKDALCPDASCERAQSESHIAEPCEHQLDLLVDVIDILTSEHAEVLLSEDESYNEAAQTLLTIGNLAHLSQPAQNQIPSQDHITGTTSVSVNESYQHQEEEIASMLAAQEESATRLMSATSGHGVLETPEIVDTVELQKSTTDSDDVPIMKSSDQGTGSDMDPSPQFESIPESPKKSSAQTRKGRLSKVKPKPNLGQASRTAQSKSQPAEESRTVAPDLSQDTETLSAAEETPKIDKPSTEQATPIRGSTEALVQESSDHLTPCVTPVEELPVSQKGESEIESTGQTRKSRFQKVKPNLGQTSRTVRSEPQTPKDTVEKDSNPTLRTSQSCALDLIPSLDVGSTVTPSEELSTPQDKKYVESDGATSDQSASGNQNFPEAQSEPSREQSTDEKLISHEPRTAEGNNPLTSDTESQVGQGSNTVQESSDHPGPCVEELPVESKAESTCQIRRGRLPKVKPNLPQMSKTVRSKPQTTKDPVTPMQLVEKPSRPESTDNTIAEVEAEPTCSTSPSEKTSQIERVSVPLLKGSSTHKSTEELSTTEENKTDVGIVGKIESGTLTSDQSASENQNFSETQFESSREQATRDTTPTLESTDEQLLSRVGTAESTCTNPLASDAALTESQVGKGSNIDSVPVQESSDHPAPCVEELPVSQKEEREVKSACQSRRARLPKVKPKLPQTSRTVQSKPQTAKDPVEKDSKPSPDPQFHEKTKVEVEAEPTCTIFPESQSRGPASDLTPSLGVGPTVTPSEELSTTEEGKTNVGVVGLVESGRAISDQSASGNQGFPEAQFEPNREQATRDTRSTPESMDQELVSHVETAESDNLLTSVAAVTESQVSQGSNKDPVPVQESTDHPAPCVQELPVSQKEEREVKPTSQVRRGQLQKVKPNLPQTSRTVQSKPQTTKDTTEKDSNPTPNPKFHQKTIVELEAKPACITSPEKSSQSGLDLGSSVAPSEELSATEDKTDVGVVGLVESGGATSDQSASGNQFEATKEQATKDTLTSNAAVTEPQVGQGSNKDSVPVQESSDHPAPCVQELPVSPKEVNEVKSSCQARRGRLQKVKPKLPQTSRTVQSKPQTTKDPVITAPLAEKPPRPIEDTIADVESQPTCSTAVASVSVASLEVCSTSKPTDKVSSMEEPKTDAECGLDSNSESSEQNVPQRRRRFPKVKPKPNLGSPRTTHTKPQSDDISKPSEQRHMDTSLTSKQPVDNNKAQTELSLTADSKTSTELLGSTMLGPAEKSLDSTKDKGTSSDASSWVAENQSVLTDTVLENKSSEEPTVEGESSEMSIRATDTNTQPKEDPTSVSDVRSSEDGSTESKIESILHTNTQTTPNPTESTHSEEALMAQSQDAVQQCSETNQTAAQSTDNNQSEPADSPSRKAPLTRRGRLVKPKPSLVRSSQPRQQGQNTKQAEADSGIQTEVMDASVSQPVSEHQPDTQEPVEGAIEQHINRNSTPSEAGSSLGSLTQVIEQLNQPEPAANVAGSSLGCVTQEPGSCTQDASTPSTVGTQSHPSLTIFPHLLSQQVPSDPDEPFFILSLTEIPVSSSGEVLGSVPEPLPYLPVTDASMGQQSSVPGESSAVAGDDIFSLSYVALPVSTGPNSAEYIDPIMQNPVAPHESTTVHPSQSPETLENNETQIPPAKQRRAKQPVKPSTTKRKQASKTVAAKEAESVTAIQHSELPGPSVQPEAFDDVVTEPQEGSGDHVEVETVEDPEDGRSGGQTGRKRGTGSRKRKPKGVLPETENAAAPLRDPPPGKAASKGPKVKAPRASGKKSTRAPAASTSRDVAPTARPTEEIHSTSSPVRTEVDVQQTSTPSCSAEVSVSQQSLESSSVEQEPTCVSQYFLSDIFTDVEEP